MKQQRKKATTKKVVKKKKTCIDPYNLPIEIEDAFSKAKVTYKIETVYECIHPRVKAALEAKKKNG